MCNQISLQQSLKICQEISVRTASLFAPNLRQASVRPQWPSYNSLGLRASPCCRATCSLAWIDRRLLQDPLGHLVFLPGHVDEVDRNAVQAFDQHHVDESLMITLLFQLHKADVFLLVLARAADLELAGWPRAHQRAPEKDRCCQRRRRRRCHVALAAPPGPPLLPPRPLRWFP